MRDLARKTPASHPSRLTQALPHVFVFLEELDLPLANLTGCEFVSKPRWEMRLEPDGAGHPPSPARAGPPRTDPVLGDTVFLLILFVY